jgi:hypothetical protein
MAGLVPATPLMRAQLCHTIGVAGTSPAMTAGGCLLSETHARNVWARREEAPCPPYGSMNYPSGSGMNSVSPGTGVKRPVFQSSLASSMRSRRDDTKFHQM